MTIAPQPDPNAEMQQFFEQQQEPPAAAAEAPAATPAETQAAPATQAPAPPPNFWDEPADDDDLPPSLKGKPRREVWDNLKPALAKAAQAGFQKNEVAAQLEVQRGVNQALWSQLDRISGGQPIAPRQPQQPYQQLGVEDPQQLFSAPGQVLNAIPQYVQDQMAAALQPLQRQVAEVSGQSLSVRSELAQAEARDVLKIDKDTFLMVRPGIATLMANNGLDPTVSQNWVNATNMFRQMAARMVPATQSIAATAPAAGNARPAATAAPVARKADTTGNRHLDKALKEHLNVWNERRARSNQAPYTLAEFAEMVQADAVAGMGDE